MNAAFTANANATAAPWHNYRGVLRALALALLCGLLQALLPRHMLGAAALAPLSVVLGVAVAVAAALSRGHWTVPAAMVGVLAADLLTGSALPVAGANAAVLGLQTLTASALMRSASDPDRLQLDTADRLRRFVLVAAPAAAAVGVVGGLLAQWGLDGAASLPLSRLQLAAAVVRFIADLGGVVVTAPVLLCWLAPAQAPWRPRRRQVALPLVLLALVMLPGLAEVARRDELRLQGSFERDAQARRLRIQQLLADPVDATLALRDVLTAAGGTLPLALFDRLSAGWMARVAGLQTLGWLERLPTAASAAGGPPEWLLRQLHASSADVRALPGAHAAPDGRLALSPALRLALDQAWAGNSTVAVGVPSDPGAAPTAGQAMLLQPVPAANGGAASQRLVFAVVDPGRQLAGALPDNDPNLRACLTGRDGGPGQPAQRLAGPPGCERGSLGQALRSAIGKVAIGEQRLDLLITEPVGADNRLFAAVWLLALPAVAGAAMLSALLLALTGRLLRIEDRVRERTAALRDEIDERASAESTLAVREQRFRAIFDSVSLGVTVVDPQGRIIEVNPAFCAMMGGKADDLLQHPLADFQLPDVTEDDGTAAALGGAMARHQRYLTTDGRVLQVAANLRTLFDASGHPVATVGALQDLTPILRLREVEREREQAEVASRTQSEFLAKLADELRTPLKAIVGFAEMLDRNDPAGDGADDPGQRHGLAQIRQAGWQLLDRVNDVLDLSHLEAGSLRLTLAPLSLADLAQEAIAMVEPAAMQAWVALELSLSPQADRVQADALRLRQVLIKLLGNAIQYNRPGGRVTLRTRPAALGEVLIEIEDSGTGISEAQIGELFMPFQRLAREANTRPGKQGTGIGLVICRKLCEQMGGELSVSSREGEGSVFSLRLPRPSGEPSHLQVTRLAPLVPGVSIGSVLFIEDDEADLAEMRRLLQRRPGITLMTAGSAAQGLARAHDADLILLDLDLPDRPGIALLRALKSDARLRHTPVIVVSAESRPQRIDECFDAGAAQFLTKPLDAQQTLKAIDDNLF